MNRALQIRLDSRLGIVEAAEAAGVHPRTLNKVEAGQRVGVAALSRLADFYKVQPSELLMPAVVSPLPEEAA